MLAGGLSALWPEIKARVEALGAEVHKNGLGRVDPCVDLAGVHVQRIAERARQATMDQPREAR